MKRHHPVVPEGEDLAVEHDVGTERGRTGADLGKLRGDVLQVAAVEGDLAATTVELTPDSVILSSTHTSSPSRATASVRIRDRRRKHRTERNEPAWGGVVKPCRSVRAARPPEVAGEHHRATHRTRLGVERQAIASSTSPSRNPMRMSLVINLATYRASFGSDLLEQRSQHRGSWLRSTSRGHLRKRAVEVAERDRLGRQRPAAFQQVARHVPGIGMPAPRQR